MTELSEIQKLVNEELEEANKKYPPRDTRNFKQKTRK